MTTETPVYITSQLWKSKELVRSATFPQLVSAAAYFLGKQYTDHMLAKVATNLDIIAFINLPVREGMDAVLEKVSTDPTAGDTLDQLIVAAVDQYTPPTA